MVNVSAVQPCKRSSGTEVQLEKRISIGISAAARNLRAQGFEVTNARVLLVVKDKPKVTMFPSGRMIVNTSDLEQARQRAIQVLAALGLD